MTRYDWARKVINCELCKELKFDHTKKWYRHNLESLMGNEIHKHFWGFWDRNGKPHLDQTIRPCNNQQKKKTFRIVGFAVPANNRIKLKESKRKISTWTLIWNWKKLRDMKVTIIPIVIGALGTVHKGFGNNRTSGINPNSSIGESC